MVINIIIKIGLTHGQETVDKVCQSMLRVQRGEIVRRMAEFMSTNDGIQHAHILLLGMLTGTTTSGSTSVVFTKAEHVQMPQLSNLTSRYMLST